MRWSNEPVVIILAIYYCPPFNFHYDDEIPLIFLQ
jgi:hypothetical protein